MSVTSFDPTMAWNHHIKIKLVELMQGLHQLRRRAVTRIGHVINQVSGDEYFLCGEKYHDVSARMAVIVGQPHFPISTVERKAVVKRDIGQDNMGLTKIGELRGECAHSKFEKASLLLGQRFAIRSMPAVEHLPILLNLSRKVNNLILQFRRGTLGHIFAGFCLAEELDSRKRCAVDLVSLHVIAMPMSVDNPTYRFVGDLADLLEDDSRGSERSLGVDNRHRVIEDEDGGVGIVEAFAERLQNNINTRGHEFGLHG